MYIQPNSTIELYKGVPLDPTYTNTLYFDNLTAQSNYFHNTGGILVRRFTQQSYTRVNRGIIRINATADELYNVNYMSFRNTAFGNKWFYGFVTSVEYVNDVTTEIHFEIDDMQTWLFDVTLKECFVEREHSSTDTFNDWIVKENLDVGDYAFDKFNHSGLFNDWCILALAPYNYKGEQPIDTQSRNLKYNGVASGCYANVITQENCSVFGAGGSSTIYEGLWEWLRQLERDGHSDAIVSISMIPKALIQGMSFDTSHTTLPNTDINADLIGFSVRKPSTTLGNYTPKNKKLFSYPYSYLGVQNTSGEMGEYHWELFKRDLSDPYCRFGIKADFITGNYTLFPLNYNCNSGAGDTSYNVTDCLTMSGVPLCSYNNDAYTIWFAQNKVSMLTQGLGAIGSFATANPIGVMTGIHSVMNLLGTFVKQSAVPDYVKGGGGSSTYFGAGFQDFMYTHVHVQPEIARSIDDYFTMFGYATKRVKLPNRNVRQRWTYTKTIDCKLIGNAPADSIKHICELYDKGITFWKNASEVGNYSLTNNPI